MGDFWVVRWGQVGCGKTNKYTISFQELNAYEREKKFNMSNNFVFAIVRDIYNNFGVGELYRVNSCRE
jgi:hypothetical protein